MIKYNLDCHKNNLFITLDYYEALFDKTIGSHTIDVEEKYTLLTGIINTVWQEWSEFWRSFWLSVFIGGYSFKASPPLTKVTNSDDENTILFYIKAVANTSKKVHGCLVGSYQELTWGDIDKIKQISFALSKLTQKEVQEQSQFYITTVSSSSIAQKISNIANIVQSTLSSYSQPIKHLQDTRNASIHLSKDNFHRIRTDVFTKYSLVNSKYEHPIQILYSVHQGNQITFKYWIDSMKALINIIEINI